MKRLIDILSELARRTSGSALVEMTIITPLAILMMVGAVDFGWALFTQATASKSVHNAARYLGSLSKSTVCDNPDWPKILQKAQNLAVYGTLTAQPGSEVIRGWSPSDVQTTVDCTRSPPTITVTATVSHHSIIATGFLPIPSIFTLSATHEERQVGS
jgi:Flp pilus assembly protein TadG